MDTIDIELHDARLLSCVVDYVQRTATVGLDYFPNAQASTRASATIHFSGVRQFNEVTDLLELEDHASAGNIASWIPASGPGTTYIYLARGLIAISAERLEFTSAVESLRPGRLPV